MFKKIQWATASLTALKPQSLLSVPGTLESVPASRLLCLQILLSETLSLNPHKVNLLVTPGSSECLLRDTSPDSTLSLHLHHS